jgi:membrane-associated phospholipid phosphatase
VTKQLVALLLVSGIHAAIPTVADGASLSACEGRNAPSMRGLVAGTVSGFGRLPSRANAAWLISGGGAAAATHPADDSVSRRLVSSAFAGDLLGPGAFIGSGAVQLGAGAAAYSIGRIAGSPCTAAVGGDLLRAQLMAEAMTFALQYSIRRRRPDNGSGFSFPSGHVSVAFATATVLQQFGWKAGASAYALASYVAVSRIQAERHYLSDVVFGAALGIVAGRAGLGDRTQRFVVVPSLTPGGGGIFVVRKYRRSRAGTGSHESGVNP